MGLQAVKNENNPCWICSLQRQSLEGQHCHICCGTCKQSLYGRESEPLIPPMSGMRWNQNQGVCITRLTFSLQLFMIWVSKPNLATQNWLLLLDSTRMKGQRFPHRIPGMLSVSAPAKINMQPAAKRLPVTSSSFEGHLAFK